MWWDSVADDIVDALIYAALNTEPVELNELEAAQADAAAAATAAMTAAGNAATSATAATEAVANLATVQTGETSRGLATKAGEQAALAHAAYMTAKTASDAAEAATDVTAAVRAQVNAENALADAMAAETMAGNYGQMAMDAAGNELIIVDTVKTVGGTSIDATAPASEVTAGVGDDAQTTRTGLLDEGMQPMATGTGSTEVAGTAGDTDADEDPYEAPVAAAADRMFPIGKLVDSADDTARLMIVTQYAGTKTVKVYAPAGGNDLTGRLGSDGRIQTAGAGDEDLTNDVFVSLKAVGKYHLAGLATDENGLATSDMVGDEAESAQVYSYKNASNDTVYVVLGPTTVAGDTTTVVYEHVGIHVQLDRDIRDADNSLNHE